ncbi:hypothetical protein V8F33_001722 [Rhypophila sp. PSN 637]
MAHCNTNTVNEVPAGNFGSDFLVLSLAQAQRINEFRDQIRRCTTDTHRYDLCAQARDNVLQRDTEVQLLADAYEQVIEEECIVYKEWKENKAEAWRSLVKTEEDEAQWERFAQVAQGGSDVKSRCIGPLKTVDQYWGADFVRHYQLASKGVKYCEVTGAASREVRDLDEAVTKLNRLMLRRHTATGRGVRRLLHAVNPIAQADLVDLKAWSHRESFNKDKQSLPYRTLVAADLPSGFGFDKFGLMVQEEFAISSPAGTVEPATESGAGITRRSGPGPNDAAPVGVPGLEPSDGTNPRVSNCTHFVEQVSNSVLADEELNELSSEGARSEDGHPTAAHSSSGSCRSTTPLSSPPESPPLAASMLSGDARSSDIEPQPLRRILRSQATTDAPGGREPAGSARNADHDTDAPAARLRGRSDLPNYRETPPKRPKTALRQRGLLSTARLQEEQCCPPEIPIMLLAFLDKMDGTVIPTFMLAGVPLQDMCYAHLKKYTEVITSTKSFRPFPKVEENLQTSSPGSTRRRRRASLPELIDPTPLKRLRSDDQPAPGGSHLPATSSLDSRPKHDSIRDEAYRRQVLRDMRSTEYERDSWGYQTNELVYEILYKSRPATDAEAYFLSREEASQRAELGPLDSPIFTQGQQRFQWKGKDRPILQLFHRMEDLGLDRAVSVQVPSRRASEASSERKTLCQVRDRFLSQQSTGDPWNLLDLQGSLPSTLPAFLEGDNCQLLIRIRDTILMGNDAERILASREDWNTWRNVLKWALLSEGGNNTGPHMDSHGYSTWITPQEGRVGFGWMSRPSQQEEDEWIADPQGYTGGKWRYVILSPGHTVFFPSGTIHFVFRLQAVQTFALGGHVLQWSGIERWLKVIHAQLRHPDITNEDISSSAPQYAQAVERLVANRMKARGVEEMGGPVAVAGLTALIEVSG